MGPGVSVVGKGSGHRGNSYQKDWVESLALRGGGGSGQDHLSARFGAVGGEPDGAGAGRSFVSYTLQLTG